MAIGPRKFQHTFGRSAQTKALDKIWEHQDNGLNIKQLSKEIGQSYQYTVLITKDLESRGLIRKETVGVQSILKPNKSNAVMRWIDRMD